MSIMQMVGAAVAARSEQEGSGLAPPLDYAVVLTKADKIKSGALAKVQAAVEAEALKHPASFPRVLATSAEKPLGPIGGMMDLRDAVARVLLGMGDDFGDMFA